MTLLNIWLLKESFCQGEICEERRGKKRRQVQNEMEDEVKIEDDKEEEKRCVL